MKFQFSAPTIPVAEKYRLSLAPDVLGWVESEAKANGSTLESVIEQAIKFAFISTQIADERPKKPKAKPSQD